MTRMYLANTHHKVLLQSHQPSNLPSSTVQLWMHHPQSPTLDAQKILQEQHTRWAWHYVICTEILSSNTGKDTSLYHDCYCHKTVQVHRYPSHHLPQRNTWFLMDFHEHRMVILKMSHWCHDCCQKVHTLPSPNHAMDLFWKNGWADKKWFLFVLTIYFDNWFAKQIWIDVTKFLAEPM